MVLLFSFAHSLCCTLQPVATRYNHRCQESPTFALQAAIRREEDRQIIASQDAEYEATGLPTVEFFKLPAVTWRGKACDRMSLRRIAQAEKAA